MHAVNLEKRCAKRWFLQFPWNVLDCSASVIVGLGRPGLAEWRN